MLKHNIKKCNSYKLLYLPVVLRNSGLSSCPACAKDNNCHCKSMTRLDNKLYLYNMPEKNLQILPALQWRTLRNLKNLVAWNLQLPKPSTKQKAFTQKNREIYTNKGAIPNKIKPTKPSKEPILRVSST